MRLIARDASGWPAPGDAGEPEPALSAEGAYWVTGGTGSLGLRTAEELAALGAGCLVITGRRGAASLGAEDKDRLRTLKRKTEVLVLKSDVTSPRDIKAVLNRLSRKGIPLRGIVHAAAAFDAAVLENLSANAFQQVVDVKYGGALNLHELTQGEALDFFVVYSSVLSIWGAAGQAAYAGANAAVDALVHYRRSAGLPATVINWGPWAQSNAGDMGGKAGAAMWRARATEALADSAYLPHLRMALSPSSPPQVMVCATDWQRFAQQFSTLPPLFSKLCTPAAPQSLGVGATGAPGGSAGISRVAGELLGFADDVPVDQPLTELGLDSLLAVNLANRLRDVLGVTVPTAVLLKGATIAELAAMGDSKSTPASGEAGRPTPGNSSAEERRGDGWLIFPAPRPAAKMRLVCFPFAGGGAGTFRAWTDRLSADIEVVAIEPPGRQTRIEELPLRRLEDFVEQLVPHLAGLDDKPFAVYGHCLGALTLYETVCELGRAHGHWPMHALVSGARPPDQIKRPQSFEFDLLERLVQIPEYSVFEPVHAQADIVFGEVIKQFNILATTEMLAFDELRELLLPLIRAEFEMSSNYLYEPKPRWQFPLTCLHGRRDSYATEENARSWARFTDDRFELQLLDSEHFLVVEEDDFVIGAINQALAPNAAVPGS